MKDEISSNTSHNDYSEVLTVIGISIFLKILFSSLGLDMTETAAHIGDSIVAAF